MRHLWLVLIISLCELSCIHDTCTADDGLTTASPPTVALLQVGDSDKPLADAMGLLEATLLESDELKMVERERLAAVLEELELSSSQLAIDGVTAVQLGRLLKADLLVWVGKPPQAGSDVREVVILGTRYGLRYASGSIRTLSSPESASQEIRAVLDDAIQQFQSPFHTIIAIPPFRNDDFTFDKDHLRYASVKALEHYLKGVPGVRVVELTQAQHIAHELSISGELSLARPLPQIWHGRFATDQQGHRIEFTLACHRNAVAEASVSEAFSNDAEAIVGLRTMAHRLLRQTSVDPPPSMPNGTADAAALYHRARSARDLGYYSDAYHLTWAALLVDESHEQAPQLLVDVFRGHVRNCYHNEEERFVQWLMSPSGMDARFEPQERHRQAKRSVALEAYAVAQGYARYARDREIKVPTPSGFVQVLEFLPLETAAEVLVPLLRYKQQQDVHDQTALVAQCYYQHCRSAHEIHDCHRFLLKVAPYLPVHTNEKQSRTSQTLSIFTNGFAMVERVDSIGDISEALSALESIDTPQCKSIASDIRELWQRHESYRPPGRRTYDSEGPWEARLVRIDMPVPKITGWAQTNQSFDLFWGCDFGEGGYQLFRLDAPGRWEALTPILQRVSSSQAVACFDGRYVWAAVPDATGPRIVAIEPRSKHQLEFTVADGVPNSHLDGFAVAPIGPGDVAVVATTEENSIVRCWIGRLTINEHESKRVRILHTAREQVGSGVNRAFYCRTLRAWPEPFSELLIDRVGSGSLLKVSLQTGDATLLPDHHRLARIARIDTSDRALLSLVPVPYVEGKLRIGGGGAMLYQYDPDKGRNQQRAAWVPAAMPGAIIDDKLYQVGFAEGLLVTDLHSSNARSYKTELPLDADIKAPFNHGVVLRTQHFGPVFARDYGRLYQIQTKEQGTWRGVGADALPPPERLYR